MAHIIGECSDQSRMVVCFEQARPPDNKHRHHTTSTIAIREALPPNHKHNRKHYGSCQRSCSAWHLRVSLRLQILQVREKAMGHLALLGRGASSALCCPPLLLPLPLAHLLHCALPLALQLHSRAAAPALPRDQLKSALQHCARPRPYGGGGWIGERGGR